MKQKIDFAVTSNEGHSEFSMLPKEALAKIRQLEKEEDKWVFVGKDHVKSETLTETDLIGAMDDGEDITLVTSIAGGNCVDFENGEKAIVIEMDVVEKKSGLVIDFESTEYEKKVVIKLGKESLYDVLHDRDIIVAAIEKKLDNLASSQVEDLRKILNA